MDDRRESENVRIVAIVDDDAAIRAALSRLIRTIGYVTSAYASGEELLSLIDDLQPACVLTDIQMPSMNGFELADKLRGWRQDLPIAIMTAYPSLANRALALAAGVREYMTKPLDDKHLEAWLAREIGLPPS